jgi:hypothetical protein
VFSVRQELDFDTLYYLADIHLERERERDTDVPCSVLLGCYVSTEDVAFAKVHVWLGGWWEG